MKKISLVSLILLLSISCFAQKKSSKLAEYRRIINEINEMELKQVESCGYGMGSVYFDTNSLIRKQIYCYGGESERVVFISYYDEPGNAIYIAYLAGNNMEDEKGFTYLDKGEIILQNSITYPYYEEYYVDGQLVTEGKKGGFKAKTEGTFSFQTSMFKMGLSLYAHTDSLKKYCKEYGQPIELSEKAIALNFKDSDIAYVTSCSDGPRKLPDLSSPVVDSFIYLGAPVKVLEKCKGEVAGNWGFNYWYKVDCGEVGYIYGAFLEPVESTHKRLHEK